MWRVPGLVRVASRPSVPGHAETPLGHGGPKMSGRDDEWLTLQEAAEHAGCSTKTLYRRMRTGHLEFRIGANNRRYIRLAQIQSLFPETDSSRQSPTEPSAVLQAIQALRDEVARQTQLLERALALYQPRSLEDVLQKHWGQHHQQAPGREPDDHTERPAAPRRGRHG